MNRTRLLFLTVLAASFLGRAKAEPNQVEHTAREAIAQAKPNRTLPLVQPPKTTLEFSAQPTIQEISRARVFEEPLVPIGGEPSVDENVALAAALLGQDRRVDPEQPLLPRPRPALRITD